MTTTGIPYFMTNKEWYTQVDIFKDGFPDDDRGYHLTDKAPQEAIDSYNEFYGIVDVKIDPRDLNTN